MACTPLALSRQPSNPVRSLPLRSDERADVRLLRYAPAMRIIRFLDEHGSPTFGVDHNDGAATELRDTNDIAHAAMLHERALRTDAAIDFQSTGRRCEVKRILAPLMPTDIVCIGRNFVREGAGADADAIRKQELEVFLKPRSSIVGPGDALHIPAIPDIDPDAHAEGELVIVIKRRMRCVPAEHALDYVLGFTLANDVTARHWSTPTGSPLWMRGKGFDTFCPLGPAIATLDEFGDLHATRIETRMNGTLAMSSPPTQMARSIEHALAELSSRLTLYPGTIVLTGGPPLLPGVPSDITRLRPGTRVDISAGPIGTLTNTVAA